MPNPSDAFHAAAACPPSIHASIYIHLCRIATRFHLGHLASPPLAFPKPRVASSLRRAAPFASSQKQCPCLSSTSASAFAHFLPALCDRPLDLRSIKLEFPVMRSFDS
ncbi:hypothetical protein DFH07DRAFT_954799 [Mycena maculata]|uniref:Uncharacterized protein n=1 Tax=Mycena maculata TaxID=230809 RepID=A0AAD7JMA0_9AGAR|nr:hypothetical protein DFH07DRAFT_954799 [Mycena maculata]